MIPPHLEAVLLWVAALPLFALFAESIPTFALLCWVAWREHAPEGKWSGRWFVIRETPKLYAMAVVITAMIHVAEVLEQVGGFDPCREAADELRSTIRLWGYWTEYIYRRMSEYLPNFDR